MANQIIAGYMQPAGAKLEVIVDHSGPSSYNNTGTFSTSGDVLNASDLGLGGIEMVLAMDSDDGLNEIKVASPPIAAAGGVPASFALHWFVTATSTEVANGIDLSARSVRLLVRGV